MERLAGWIGLALAGAILCLVLACGDPAQSDPAEVPGPERGGPPELPLAPGDAPPAPEAPPPGATAPQPDRAWIEHRPHTSMLFVGNQRGKLKPCGCSEPQLGGIERVATLVDLARRRASTSFAALSLGWSLDDTGEAQAAAKAEFYRAALEVLGFEAHLLGTSDLFVPALAQPFLDGPPRARPTPPANAPLSDSGPLACAVDTEPLCTVQVGALTVRALSILNPDEAATLRGVVREVYPPAGAFGRLTPRHDTLWVVSTDATAATIHGLVETMRRLGPTVIVDLGGEIGTERIENASLADGPFVVTIGNLGKEAGLVDLDPVPEAEGGGWRISYHAVELEPRMEQYPSPLRTRVGRLIETYKQQVRWGGYLAAFDTYPAPGDIGFVGSTRCAECHPGIFEDWLKTPHARALRTLSEKGYEWDPECVRCHVVGFLRFGESRWGRVAGGFIDATRTPHLGGVGCESCHGPGEAHVESPRDKSLWGPGGPNRANPGRRDCQVCHDVENSVRFPAHYEDEYRPRADHRGVPSDRRYVEPNDR